jgi:hypothetical protein
MTPGGVNESRYCAGIKGRVSLKNRNGFIGLGCYLNRTKRVSDLSHYTGIIFSFRGTPSRYRLKIHTSSTPDYDDFGYDFQVGTAWETMRIPFKSIAQEGWGNVAHWVLNGEKGAGKTALSLNWQTLEAPKHEIEFYIDDVYFYK